MTSVESIGSCSLDFDASELSENCRAQYLTASEYTLQSSRVAPCVNGSHKLDELPKQQKSGEDSVWLTNGNGETTKREYTIAEIKLPSYVSISCAVNGYANYSRFCRSRDNSPARAFRKSSLEANFSYDPNASELVQDRLSAPSVRCSRSHSDCNGNSRSVFTESKEVTVSKQLQIPLKAPTQYMTEIVINSSELKNTNQELLNGHSSEEFSLAKEVGIGGAKSLVQQRIESLYGVPAQEKAKFGCRTSRMNDNPINRNAGSVAKRSPSCPPQVMKNQLDNNLPVFRHLTKNFRDQLLLDDAAMANCRSGAVRSSPKSRSLSSREGEGSSIKNNSAMKHSVIEAETNGFHSLPSEIGIDECDRTAFASPSVSVILKEGKPNNNFCVSPTVEKDGHSFLKVMETEKMKIQDYIKKWEEELRKDIPEEASGRIRSACGKANLLLSQKFEQFRGLCLKNIEENKDVPFYTTSSDLAGFWDMVMLQVNDIQSTFDHIQHLKENGWQEIKPAVLPVKARKVVGAVSKSNPCTPKRTAKSAELAQAREEARKQLLAAKRRGRQQNTSCPDTDVSIFIRDAPS